MRALSISLLLLASSCGPREGSERGKCYGNGTCDTGLVCMSETCVRTGPAPEDPAEAKARVTFTRLTLRQFQEAFVLWYVDHPEGGCPAKLEELLPHLRSKDLNDPWGSRYVMKCGPSVEAPEHFDVISPGPDRKEGTEDDLSLAKEVR